MDDGNQPVVPEVQTTPNKKLFNILEVGFFEIAFVLGTILIIFLGLNFFRILRLEASFPFLSFLPHLSGGPAKKTQNTNPYAQYLKATPTPSVDKTTQNLITTSAKQVIPATFTSAIAPQNAVVGKDGSISLSWESYVLNNTGTMIEKMKKDNSGIYNKTFYISAKTTVSYPITDAEATLFVNTRFINPQIAIWQCNVNGTQSSCTSETTAADGTKINFIVSATSDIPNRVFIKNCTALPNTDLYKQSNYCLL